MSKSWAENVRKNNKKTNNHPAARTAKVAIRRLVLSAVKNPRVLDAFAGSGRMHRDVWHSASKYVGCDLKWYRDSREAYVVDNKRVLRTIDLAEFNIFDLDAYGSPWEQVLIIAARRNVEKGERIAFCITDGSGLNMKMGGLPLATREITGITAVVAGASQLHSELIDMAVKGLASRMRCGVISRWEAEGITSAQVRYLGLVLEGQ